MTKLYTLLFITLYALIISFGQKSEQTHKAKHISYWENSPQKIGFIQIQNHNNWQEFE
jgi:hypothetical protein